MAFKYRSFQTTLGITWVFIHNQACRVPCFLCNSGAYVGLPITRHPAIDEEEGQAGIRRLGVGGV